MHYHYNHLEKLVEKSEILKKCSKCNIELPATTSYFYKDRRAKDGLRSECIQCHRLSQKERYKRKNVEVLKSSG
ncbi:MAG: hypothetical protein ACXABO_15025 [Promethearchaeota archaeon]|jgi:hypothetical protein